MCSTVGPVTSNPDDVPIVNVPRSTLAHWAEVAAFAIDNGPEAVDALLELAEGLEDVLAGDR